MDNPCPQVSLSTVMLDIKDLHLKNDVAEYLVNLSINLTCNLIVNVYLIKCRKQQTCTNQNSYRNRKDEMRKKKTTTSINHRAPTCFGANPHGKLVYAGFPDLCAMLPDVAVAG